ncbi:MAG: septal ring lytic transglycosylase RlpA family protein [Gammaproteobacteria bacterium]|nr:septal ring lytic transglycosylase RlpA family protein [Gammaproteobacteria bacterium]MBU1722585.1 septal ring lytic transglycosylase RlpA family protein [Gammaproteobacteria bacterium]MBU2007057.1 septal ring lytic transglycosylase RlpA family protein [Gammaproteobacteria bacterium]
MPTVSGAASKSVQAAQPVAFPAAPPQQQQADNKAKAYQVGTASYYGNAFNGKKTASGERFDQNDLTCAHGSLPFGCKIRVTNLRNKKSVEVKVNDRGGFQKHGRVIDLSKAAAKEIGMLNTGTAKVQIEVLE